MVQAVQPSHVQLSTQVLCVINMCSLLYCGASSTASYPTHSNCAELRDVSHAKYNNACGREPSVEAVEQMMKCNQTLLFCIILAWLTTSSGARALEATAAPHVPRYLSKHGTERIQDILPARAIEIVPQCGYYLRVSWRSLFLCFSQFDPTNPFSFAGRAR